MNNNIKYAIHFIGHGYYQTKYSFARNLLDAKLYKTKRAARSVLDNWLSPHNNDCSGGNIIKVKVLMTEVI